MIWASYYWDAAAIDQLGKEYDLPNAIGNCLSFQIWGEDQIFYSGKAPEVAIMLKTAPEFPGYAYYDEVTPVKSFTLSNYSMYGLRPVQIYICRKPKANFRSAFESHMNYLSLDPFESAFGKSV